MTTFTGRGLIVPVNMVLGQESGDLVMDECDSYKPKLKTTVSIHTEMLPSVLHVGLGTRLVDNVTSAL